MNTVYLAGRRYDLVSNILLVKSKWYGMYKYNEEGDTTYAVIETTRQGGASILMISPFSNFDWESRIESRSSLEQSVFNN